MSTDEEKSESTPLFSANIQIGKLRQILAPPALLDPNSDAVFRISPNKIIIRSVDGAQVIMAHQTISKEAFETYELDGDAFTFGVQCDILREILSSRSSSSYAQFEIDQNKGIFTVTSGDVFSELGGISSAAISEAPDSEHEYTTKIKLHSKSLHNTADTLEVIGGTVKIKIQSDVAKVSAADDTNKAEINLAKGEHSDQFEFMEIQSSASAKYEYALLEKLVRLLPDDRSVKLSLKDDYPVSIQAEIFEDANAEFILAPKT